MELMLKLRKKKSFFSAYIPGISGIPNKEEKRSKKVVLKACSFGDANVILRNVLLLLKEKSQDNIRQIETWIESIIGPISIDVRHDEEKDLFISCDVTAVSRDTTDFSHLEAAVRQGIPLVQFDRVIEELDTSKVVVDDFNGAYAGVHHLLEAGYTRIAHLAGREHVTIGRERFEGYRQALQDHGFPVDERLVIPGGFQEHDGEQGMKRLLELDSPPDAVFTVNDPVAIGAYRVLRERGLRIPHDVALLGFCNNPESALVEPPLSTVAQPAWQMGKAAAQLLFRQFEQKNFTPQTQVLRTRLIVRQST
jgi:DNA-binding LacI/PurR family transcriptional regulator